VTSGAVGLVAFLNTLHAVDEISSLHCSKHFLEYNNMTINYSYAILAYFLKVKVGLSDHQFVCLPVVSHIMNSDLDRYKSIYLHQQKQVSTDT
jgi:hypothetical protein